MTSFVTARQLAFAARSAHLCIWALSLSLTRGDKSQSCSRLIGFQHNQEKLSSERVCRPLQVEVTIKCLVLIVVVAAAVFGVEKAPPTDQFGSSCRSSITAARVGPSKQQQQQQQQAELCNNGETKTNIASSALASYASKQWPAAVGCSHCHCHCSLSLGG